MPRPPGRIQRTNAYQVPRQLRRHRYRLGFEVNPSGAGRLLVVGLNPSTASLTHRDPTVDSFCRGLAVANGYRELEIVNLFALRSTDKTALLRDRNPIGRATDSHIAAACREADAILLAWGLHFHPLIATRAAAVETLIHRHTCVPVLILARNADNSPAHPLYRSITSPLVRLELAQVARRAGGITSSTSVQRPRLRPRRFSTL